MMAQSKIFLVAALLITTLSCCSAENVYCVTPTATSCSFCPHNNHCATLFEYAQEAELYFTSNTTMVFLPGDHALNMSITVASETRLTMRGESSSGNRATVVCSGSVGLRFTSMVEFKIYSLDFTSCSRLLRYAITVPDSPPGPVYAALDLQSTQHTELVNCSFHGNPATALVVNNTDITLAGSTEFTHNRACGISLLGGAIIALSSNLTFTGNTTFLDNSANFVQCPICTTAFGGGAVVTLNHTVLSFSGSNSFINNSADYVGGAILTLGNTVLSLSGTNNFINNYAEIEGGAIYTFNNAILNLSGTNNFINNCARDYGGAIYTKYDIVLGLNGANNFIHNLAGTGGGAISANNTVLSFNGTSHFINNSAAIGGAIMTNTNNTLTFNGTIYFTNNGHYGRGVNLMNGYNFGGGIFMGLMSTLSLLRNTTVYWENNHATLGGAIYVNDVSPTASYCTLLGPYGPKAECFFQLPCQNLSNGIDVQLVFKNNSADAAGSVLYGGAIDNCKLTHGLDSHNSGEVFDMMVHNNNTDHNSTSNISSDPFQICLCEHNLPDCSENDHIMPRTVYPGETFQVSVVAVGQRHGTVPSQVVSIIDQGSNPGHLPNPQHLQQANNTCTKLNYKVLSLSGYVEISLHADDSPCSLVLAPHSNTILHITVNLNWTCPPGFNISETEKSCVCEPRLAQYTGEHKCTITNGVANITRDSGQQFWVGYDDQSHGLILNPLCPFDYCVSQAVNISLNNTDMQCAYNRSSLLCGCCKKGYSLVLGTSHCKQCTNSHLALLIPFAVMGVALVFLLLVCKLTVAAGTLSGLVFYANIVGSNRTIFLPVESTGAFSVFIAWLNLDFGIETCFYDGMDAYSKTWLQFVFPVYIWLLVGLMILVSNYSHRFANMLGKNPVSVLATLILLSYTKILRTLIAVFYITYLEYPTYNRRVWLYNANIDYLSGKHIPLFLVAVLVFLFLFLPYTLLLLLGQWLQAISHLRLFSWVNSARLKPFIDAYHAPYKAKHRYWPGLLLVLRFVLLLVFALNPQQHSNANLLVILVGAGIFQLWAWVSGGVFRNWCLDALEGSFVLNLITLAAATFFVKLSQGNQLAVGYTSVSIALATFMGILVFQLASVMGIIHYLKRKCIALTKEIRNQAETDVTSSPGSPVPDRLINPEDYEPPFSAPQGHTTAEQTVGAQRRPIPAYTYGSIN